MKLSVDGCIRRSVYAAFAAGIASFAVPALAQEAPAEAPAAPEAPAVAPKSDAVKLERVQVTGSRIKRIDAEGALPIETITKAQIERAGYKSTEELLAALPVTSTLGGTQLSTGAGSSTYGNATVSLRGLDADRTLVLINGRRLAPQAGASGVAINVNTIPLAAIERVEVLKDGASSAYGSDAVAGVVNFILKKNYNGLEAFGEYGAPSRSGGGKNSRVSLTGGYGDIAKDRFNVLASISYEDSTALYGKDREFANTAVRLPYFSGAATGQGNIEGSYTPGTGQPSTGETGTRGPGFGNSPATGYGNPLAASGDCASIRMFQNPTPTSQGAPYCTYDSAPDVGLLPDRQLVNFVTSGTFQLAKNHQLYADALYGESEVTQAIQASPLRRSFMLTDSRFFETGVDPVLLIRPSNPNYQIASDYLTAQGFTSLVGQPLAVTARVFDFGGRTVRDKSTQQRYTFGARGTIIGSHEYDVYIAHNESQLKGKTVGGYFSQVAFASVVNQADSDYNPWSLTQSDTFNQRLVAAGAEYVGPTLSAKTSTDIIEASFNGDVVALPAGMLQYAAGTQYRQEKYKLDPSAALLSGDISGLGGATPPLDKSRDVAAVYGEFSLPLMKDLPLIKSLDLGVGFRGDHYDQIGNAFTYKANAGWRPADEILVRGSYGTGFRAPSLVELFYPQTLGTSEEFDDPGTGQTGLQVNALSGGNPDLKPEKSRQATYGLVWQPDESFNVSVDRWRVNIKQAINSPSAQLVVSRFRSGDPLYPDSVQLSSTGDVDSIKVITANGGALDITGYDFGAGYRVRLAQAARLEFNYNATYLSKFDETSISGEKSNKVATLVDAAGNPVIGAEGGGVAVRYKHILSTTYSKSVWSGTVTQNFYSGYEDGHDLNDNRHFIGGRSLYDLTIAYKGIKNTKIGFGMKNVFDVDPPLFIPVSNQFQSGYDAALEDPRRRFVFLNATYKFF